MGHKSVKTTQVYANIMDITLVRDLEKASYSKTNAGHII
ncbi:integrase [Bacteroides reticulotermitis JCM 10512]|uniref:Integrase n=1 Tax=Bacteroides reticulotermitis JCM 10512 TaxID=1445607 RepID=W4V007_9BACE|nr:integrase [Bacteroides reticulotermitis JCM 10512]